MLSTANSPADTPCSARAPPPLIAADEGASHQLPFQEPDPAVGLLAHTQQQTPNFSIRDYVFASRIEGAETTPNWPFPRKLLRLCLKHGVRDPLPPFEPPGLVRSRCRGREEVDSEGGRAVVAQVSDHDKVIGDAEPPSTTTSRDQIAAVEFARYRSPEVSGKKCRLVLKTSAISNQSKRPEDIASTSSTVSDPMASKVCPVCKFFVSSSNTTMNVHMDQCLRRLESDGTKLDDTTKPSTDLKSKPRKKRLMVDIYATAPYCTLEELDRRNGTTWARDLAVVAAVPAGGMPPSTETKRPMSSSQSDTRHDGDEPVNAEPPTETKRPRLLPMDVRRDGDESVYIDSNGVKLRILSKLSEKSPMIPGEESKLSKPATEPEFDEGKGVLVTKKKQFGSKPLKHMKAKQLSKKLSSFEMSRKEIQAPPAKEDHHVETRWESEEANLPLAAGNMQSSGRAALGKWVCSKRSDLPKKMKKAILKCSENPKLTTKSPSLQSHDVNSSWSTEDLRRSSPKTKRVDSLPTNTNWPSGSSSALASRPRLKVLSRSSGTSHESDHPRNATARSSGDGQDTSMKAKKIVSLKKNILARMPSSPLEAVNDDDEDDTVERIPKTFRKRRSERGGKLAPDATGTSKKVRTHRPSFFSSTLSSRIGESMEWMLPSGRNLPESEEEEEEEVVMPMEEPGHSTPEQKPLEAEFPDIVFSFSSNAQSFTHEEQASPRLNDKKEMRSFDVQMADEVAFRGEGKLRPVVRTRAETASADHESSDCLTSHGGVGLDAPLENSSLTSSQAKSDQCRTPAPLDSEPSFSPGSTASIVSTPPQEAYRPEGSEAEPTARPEHTGEARGRAIETRNEKIEMISQAKERPEQVSDGQGCCCSRREGAVPSRGMQISALCIAPPRLSSSFVSYPGLRSGSPTDLTKSSPESGAGKLLPAAYGGLGSNSASSPSQTPPTPNSVLRLMGKDLMVLKEDQSTRPSNPQPAPSVNSSPRLGVGPAPTVPEHEGYWYNYRPQLRDGPCVFGQVFPVAIHQFPLHPSSMKRRNMKEEVIVIDDSPDSGPEMADALPTIAVSNPIAQQRQFACFPSRAQYVTRDVSGGFRPVFPRTDTRELANAVRSAEGLRPLLPNPFYFRSTSTGQHHGQPVYYP
ncbi:uncharacterized protein M6B38_200655 [Iris pallida]|uniref:Uncharacterized protein n=1 Tax=Iris pallida TaxID=29817 RepID=A0AAX6E8R0_IRIPA|nr:uncharacterized protein M6B38_200655 [Iris pallida]